MTFLKNTFSYISRNSISIVVALLLFSSYPYVFDRIFPLPNFGFILIGYFTVFSFLFFKRNKELPITYKCILCIQCITWFFYFFMYTDTSYLVRIMFLLLTYLIISVLYKYNQMYNFVKLYNNIIVLQTILAIIAFVLFFVGLLKPILEFELIDHRNAVCFGLTCSNTILGNVMRASGYFDEPGALAYWGIYALVFNALFVRNKKVELGLMIGLFSTLSAAYFVQLALYIILFYYNKFKQLFLMLCFVAAAWYFVGDPVSQSAEIARYTTERFSGGTIHSSRQELSEETKVYFYANPVWGNGAKNMEKRGYYADNPYEILAKDGIIGFIVTYLPLLYVMFKYGKRNKNVLWATLILFAGYMQRPFHINLLHFFMLYLFCLLVYYKNEGYEKL